MATMMNTVSKEVIKPSQVIGLPFLDKDISIISVGVRNKKEAMEILRDIRGY